MRRAGLSGGDGLRPTAVEVHDEQTLPVGLLGFGLMVNSLALSRHARTTPLAA